MQTVSLTQSAAEKIQEQLSKRKKGLGIKIAVKTTGCSGLAYLLEFVDKLDPTLEKINCNGCTIFIDPKSCPYIQGLTVDYRKIGLNEGFEFINPNEKDRCGCGQSFRI